MEEEPIKNVELSAAKKKSEAGRALSRGFNSKGGKARWEGKTAEEKASHIRVMHEARRRKKLNSEETFYEGDQTRKIG